MLMMRISANFRTLQTLLLPLLAIGIGARNVQAQMSLPTSVVTSATTLERSPTEQELTVSEIGDDQITHPTWQILVLIYAHTDFTYMDEEGRQRRVIGTMEPREILQAAGAARSFFEYDVPLLTSGMQTPNLTIRYPKRALSEFSDFCQHMPSKDHIAAELDPNFDSIIVIWEDEGVDIYSDEPINLMHCGGAAWYTGIEPTYTVIPVKSIGTDGNIFKHEWGHSILFYFEAAGTAPTPAVNNHINDEDTRYVNCLTGEAYILADETSTRRIPNSIYNNESGFTHDYYSGLTATPDQPNRCLGINSDAWASPPPTQNNGR